MSLISSLKSTLTFVDNAIQNGKVNLTVENPVVEVSAEEALKVAQPYLMLIGGLLFIGLIILARKKGVA